MRGTLEYPVGTPVGQRAPHKHHAGKDFEDSLCLQREPRVGSTRLEAVAVPPLPAGGMAIYAKANIDYHVQADWHYYSVPYPLTQQQIEVRLAVRTVELFHKGRRVAAHPRSRIKGGFTTDPAHRPKAHEKHLDWSRRP